MWNYVYFMVLINVKDPTEYTGPESYVHEMIKVCDCFFLIKKTKIH
jgi:inositol 1,4,5-triphosphate receptor type 1